MGPLAEFAFGWRWFAWIELAYVVVLSAWIIYEKRHPLATIAWILALAWLPWVGLGVYLLLGPRRLRRTLTRRSELLRRIRAGLPDPRLLSAPGEAFEAIDETERQLVRLAANSAGAPVSTGNAVRLLRNGHACYAALEESIRAARGHVHLEYYIFEPDETGARFRDLLAARAREGVRVRLLVDGVGSHGLEKFLAPLVAAGGDVAVFNPVARLGRGANLRNHRKIAVVDGRVGFLGGINIGDDYLGRGAGGAWRDTHARLEGPAAQALQQLFVEDWEFARGTPIADHDRLFPAPDGRAGDALVQVVGSGPNERWPAIQQLLFAAINGAQRRLCLTTPYFVPDEATLAALAAAALRGVDVHLLLPRRSDSRVVAAAGRSHYDRLLQAGVRIFEYLPGILHAKSLAVDGRFAVVGSANFDQRSFRLNLEVAALLFSDEAARSLEETFDQDVTLAQEVTAASRAELGLRARFFEACARLLSPLL